MSKNKYEWICHRCGNLNTTKLDESTKLLNSIKCASCGVYIPIEEVLDSAELIESLAKDIITACSNQLKDNDEEFERIGKKAKKGVNEIVDHYHKRKH